MKYMLQLTGWLVTASLCLWLMLATPVQAAQFEVADIFVLPADAVVEEDLFVTGREVIIQGTVKGDLFAAASTVLIQGEILGTAYIAAYAAVVQGANGAERGIVHSDLMSATYSLIVDGEVGQDIRSLTGGTGSQNTAFPSPIDRDSTSLKEYLPRIEEGLVLTSRAQVHGDVLATGGIVTVEGMVARDLHAFTDQYAQKNTATIGGDLWIESGQTDLEGNVEGNLNVNAQDIFFGTTLDVGGETHYTTTEQSAEAPASSVFTLLRESPDETQKEWREWLIRTVLVVAGFGLLLGLSRLLSRSRQPQRVGTTGQHLGTALVWGILSLFIVPMAIILIPVLTGLFLGIGNATVVAGLIMAVWSAIWVFSPLVSGRNLGLLLRNPLPGENPSFSDELLGVVLVVLAVRLATLPSVGITGVQGVVNALGWIAFSLSYLVAMGSLVQGWSRGRTQQLATDPGGESSRVTA